MLIPNEVKGKFENRLFGCDACQDVCPWNRFSKPNTEHEFTPLPEILNFTSPQGLSKDGNLLFLCDGTDGLKVYDATDVTNLQLIKQLPGMETYDVIANNKIALVVAKDGLYQYDYSSVDNIHLVSKINISN